MADIIIELINTMGNFLESIRDFCINLSGATNTFIYALFIVTLIVVIFYVIKESFKAFPSTRWKMKKTNYLLITIFFLSMMIVNAYTLTAPNYISVDEIGRISLTGETEGLYANITIDNTTSTMTNTTTQFYVDVITTNDTDSSMRIQIYNITDDSLVYDINFTQKFRTPFYIDISLYSTKNTTFETNFDYIYLRSVSSITNYSILGSTFTTGIFKFISSATKKLDYTETFWGEVVDNTAKIKLYEAGNYSINLLSMKTFIPGWGYEFYKPQYSSEAVNTKLDSSVSFELETNSTVKILLSEYEANKSDFFFNILKWLFIILIFCFGIFISFKSPAPLYGIGGIFLICIILMKLLGVHIWNLKYSYQ